MENLTALKEKARKLPKSCGVYLMKNSSGKVIYVGKAKSLKNRVTSYFVGVESHTLKTQTLVENIKDFEVILVDTEVEALILERSLIKTHYPKYNILLKDGKEYPYIRIDQNHPWPRVEKVRQRKDDGATYLGPYGTVSYLNTMLQIVHRIFPIVRCGEYEFKNAKRPCNYYHFGQCLGPCVLPVKKEDYGKTIEDVIQFLKGNNREARDAISLKMQNASERMDYEVAAQYRDQVTAIDNFIQKQAIAFEKIKSADAIGAEISGERASVHVINVRDNIISNRDNFVLDVLPGEDPETLLFEFILQYYENKFVPETLYTSVPLEDKDILSKAIAESHEVNKTGKVRITSGTTKEENQLIAISVKNAKYDLEENLKKVKSAKVALDLVKEEVPDLTSLERIECIDISNMGGTAIVASCVCFIEGKPSKDHYRKYNLHDENKQGPDDFGSIRYVVRKRLERAVRDNDTPNILVIDGGKGQLSSALEVKKDFPNLDIQIISIAKARFKDKGSFDSYSVSHSNERLIFPGKNRPVPLKVGSPSYRLFTQLRDEAHRFAITHHRKRRSKIRHTSLLEKISGVGPSLRKKLFDKFGSIEVISQASIDSLMEIPGITQKKALEIKTYLLDKIEK